MWPSHKWVLVAILTLFTLGELFHFAGSPQAIVSAFDAALTPSPIPSIPKRVTKITITYTSYHWWLLRWSNNTVACSLSVEHEGLPKLGEIKSQCDPKIYQEWQKTKPCNLAEVSSTKECPGLYLLQVGSNPGERQIEVELPLPSVWLSIENCNPSPPDTRCTTLPSLLLTGVEPLPNEVIIDIQGTMAGVPFKCAGNECRLPLQPTGLEGISMEFWADSSFGDSSEHYTAKVRLVPWGQFMNPEQPSNEPVRYYVDVISSQWRGAPNASCSETWQSFPAIGGPPEWLTSPDNAQALQSDVAYYYLAGALITYGIVDASACLDGGLQAPNIASPCGVETARPQLFEWQNRFDDEILKVSQNTGLPARLLKNVFSRESQIWPGLFRTYQEAGLGQLTENGADTILLWNPDFFSQFCPLVLHQSYCDLGYGNLTTRYPELTPMLRGALVRKVDASCPDCPVSIDLSEANYSIDVFAQALLANCEQAGRMITNLTSLYPGQVSSYEDLWRFTLVNYNAGPGCLSSALTRTLNAHQPLTWQNVTSYLDPVCQSAIGYVQDISQMAQLTPTPTVWLPFNQQPPTAVLPRVIDTVTPAPTTSVSPPATVQARTASPTPTASGTVKTPTRGPSSTNTPEPTSYP